MTPTRRRLLGYISAGSVGAALAGYTLRPRRHPAHTDSESAARLGNPATLQQNASVMQVVAHPDDDLYFINPETLRLLRAGVPLTSVCLTAGESIGLTAASPAVRSGSAHVSDRSHYSAARYYGSRRAYAQMVTGSMDSAWTRRELRLPGGTAAEAATLDAAPHLRLIFMNIIESGDGRPEYRGRTIQALATGSVRSVPTIGITDGPVGGVYAYTRDELLRSLDHLLHDCRPTLVNILDHDPEFMQDPRTGGYRPTDHRDHTASAQLALTAVERYRPAADSPVPLVQSYRGYANERWPANLQASDVKVKRALLTTYSGFGLPCAAPTGCGDHNVDRLQPSAKRFSSTQARYQGDTGWLRKQADGRLTAFAVLAGRAVRWTQSRAGEPAFGPPVTVGGSDLVGQVAVVTRADGRLQLFALRHGTLLAPSAGQHREVVTAVETAPGGRFGTWQGLGGPDGTKGLQARELGLPYATADAQGRVHLFARTFGRRLAWRCQAVDGSWSDWSVLPGTADVQDNVFLLPRADGRVEVFAGTRGRPYHWTIGAGGTAATGRALPHPAVSTAPTAVELADGRLRLLLREAASGELTVADETAVGTWSSHSTRLPAAGGYGPVAAAPAGSRTHVIAIRNDLGTLSTIGLGPSPLSHPPRWQHEQGLSVGNPSIAADGYGHMYAALLGVDGRLNVRRLDQDGPAA